MAGAFVGHLDSHRGKRVGGTGQDTATQGPQEEPSYSDLLLQRPDRPSSSVDQPMARLDEMGEEVLSCICDYTSYLSAMIGSRLEGKGGTPEGSTGRTARREHELGRRTGDPNQSLRLASRGSRAPAHITTPTRPYLWSRVCRNITECVPSAQASYRGLSSSIVRVDDYHT